MTFDTLAKAAGQPESMERVFIVHNGFSLDDSPWSKDGVYERARPKEVYSIAP